MALSSQRLLRPFRKLRNAMRTASKHTSPARVHDLRIQTGRVEAVVHAFMPYLKRDGERLIASLKPVRKKAARVRDLDVLTDIVSNLGIEGELRCVARLHEHLSMERIRQVGKLREAIDVRRSRVCRCLKVVSASLEKYISVSNQAHRDARRVQADVVALRLFSELVVWPRLRAENLHAFRQRVRELRYLLQLTTSNNRKFIGALGDVKDSIGEWHDWMILAARAEKLIGIDGECKLPGVIRQTATAKLNHALWTCRAMRQKYLTASSGRGGAILTDTSSSIPV